MFLSPLYSIGLGFLQTAYHLFGARSIIGQPTPLKKLISFSIMQSVTTVFLAHILLTRTLLYIFIPITHIIYQRCILEADLFPDILFTYIVPLALSFASELILLPFFTIFFSRYHWLATLWGTIDVPFQWTADLPIIFIALYYWQKNKPLKGYKESPFQPRDFEKTYIILGVFVLILHLICLFQLFPPHGKFCESFFYASILMIPLMSITLLCNLKSSDHDHRIIEHHIQKTRLQKVAIRTLQEERHDILNDLTLVSTYIQIQKLEEAQQCIAFSAASLSDRYNYATLPDDAWLTVLKFKEEEAQQRKINFVVTTDIEAPQNFLERRLLPKLTTNLIDNAFQAATKVPNPQVQFYWGIQPNHGRVLKVVNNGPPISKKQGKIIFEGGVTTKNNSSGNNGWGLAICRRIADELGGSLSYQSTIEQTSFTLSLPITNLQNDDNYHNLPYT